MPASNRASRRFAHGLLAMTFVAAALGCGMVETPDSVADGFWQAVRAGDFERARGFSTAASSEPIESLVGSREIQGIVLGPALQNETAALVETTLESAGSDHPLAFNTHLVRFEDAWRVDVRKTRRELTEAVIAASIHDIEDSLRESGEALSDALAEGAREATEAIRDAMEDLQQALEGGTTL